MEDNINKNGSMGQGGAPNPEQNRMVLSILSYIGPLVIISLLIGREDQTVKFHVKQGLVLFTIEVVISIFGSMFWYFWFILNIVNLAILVLSIIGIMNAAHKKEKELPFVGGFAHYFPI